jgi:gp6-like head-tail connector protein
MTSLLIAGPGEEPVSLAEAKAWCRLDSTDEDDLVSALIAAARLQVESETRRALVTQSWRLTLDCPRGRLIVLPVAPVSEITSATADDADIEVTLQGDAVLLPGDGYQELIVDYTAGYGAASDVPADLKQAVLALVGHWYANRDLGAAAAPAGLDRLLAGYRRVSL